MARGRGAEDLFYGSSVSEVGEEVLLSQGGKAAKGKMEDLLHFWKSGHFERVQAQAIQEGHLEEGFWPELWGKIVAHSLWQITNVSEYKEVSSDDAVALSKDWPVASLLDHGKDVPLAIRDNIDRIARHEGPHLHHLRHWYAASGFSAGDSFADAKQGSAADKLACEIAARRLAAIVCKALEDDFGYETAKPYTLLEAGEGVVHIVDSKGKQTICGRSFSSGGMRSTPLGAWMDAPYSGRDSFQRCRVCTDDVELAALLAMQKHTASSPSHLLTPQGMADIHRYSQWDSNLRSVMREEQAGDIAKARQSVASLVVSRELDRLPGEHALLRLLPDGSRWSKEELMAVPEDKRVLAVGKIMGQTEDERLEAVCMLLGELRKNG